MYYCALLYQSTAAWTSVRVGLMVTPQDQGCLHKWGGRGDGVVRSWIYLYINNVKGKSSNLEETCGLRHSKECTSKNREDWLISGWRACFFDSPASIVFFVLAITCICCIWFGSPTALPPVSFTLSPSTWMGFHLYLSNGVCDKGLSRSVGGIFLVTRTGGEGENKQTKP